MTSSRRENKTGYTQEGSAQPLTGIDADNGPRPAQPEPESEDRGEARSAGRPRATGGHRETEAMPPQFVLKDGALMMFPRVPYYKSVIELLRRYYDELISAVQRCFWMRELVRFVDHRCAA